MGRKIGKEVGRVLRGTRWTFFLFFEKKKTFESSGDIFEKVKIFGTSGGRNIQRL